MGLERGCSVTPETIREWACRFAPRVTERLRAKRRGRAGRAWSLDETDVQVAERWCALDRAIDRAGDPLDSMRSAHRDKHAVRRFLRRLVDVVERKPQRVTTDAHSPDRRAIRWILGRKVRHRCRQDCNTRTEHSHRAVPQRSDSMLGFGSFESAARFCSAFDERRNDLRARQRRGHSVPLAQQRRLFVPRWRLLIAERKVAEWAPRGERLARFVPVPCDLTEPTSGAIQSAPAIEASEALLAPARRRAGQGLVPRVAVGEARRHGPRRHDRDRLAPPDGVAPGAARRDQQIGGDVDGLGVAANSASA